MCHTSSSFIVKNNNNNNNNNNNKPSCEVEKKRTKKALAPQIFISSSHFSLSTRFFTFFWTQRERLREISTWQRKDQSPHILSASFVSHLRDSAKRAGERESLERIERATTTTTKHRSCSRRREARTRRRRRALFPEEERSQLLLRVNIDSFRGKALRPMIKIAEGEAKR